MEHVTRAGIVDEVKAMRNKYERVTSLQAKIRFETELPDSYKYAATDALQVDEMHVSFGATSGINPGDLVVFEMSVRSPMMQRFAPALEVGIDEDDSHLDDMEVGEDALS